MIRPYVIQRGNSAFWTGHDWTDEVREAQWLTLSEATSVMDRLGAGSPDTLNLIKDFGTKAESVLCTLHCVNGGMKWESSKT